MPVALTDGYGSRRGLIDWSQSFVDDRDGQRGYTLIELLITLGILAILGSLSGFWLLDQMSSLRLDAAIRQVRADVLAARMSAVHQGNKFRVTFLDSHRYLILDDDNNNGKPDPGESLENRNLQTDYKDVTVSSTNNPIFHPRGTASNLATITLTNGSRSKILTVGITGRVKVSSP